MGWKVLGFSYTCGSQAHFDNNALIPSVLLECLRELVSLGFCSFIKLSSLSPTDIKAELDITLRGYALWFTTVKHGLRTSNVVVRALNIADLSEKEIAYRLRKIERLILLEQSLSFHESNPREFFLRRLWWRSPAFITIPPKENNNQTVDNKRSNTEKGKGRLIRRKCFIIWGR